MRLASFTIKNYKVIDDTGPVKVDPDVTALVGKNESGKTAIMRAIWKSKNVAGSRFDKLYDYPRDRYTKDRAGTQEVTQLEFTLTPEERSALMSELPEGTITTPSTVTLITYYEGKDQTKSELRCDWDITGSPTGRAGLAAITALERAVVSHGGGDADVQASAASCGGQIPLDGWLWDAPTVAALQTFATAVNQWIGKDAARKDVASAERAALAALIGRAQQGDPRVKARQWAEQNLPSFIYFDDYGMLKTLIHLPSYLSQKDRPEPAIRTQTALFEWSGLDPNEVLQLGKARDKHETEEQVQRRLEERRALLESASFSLSGDWLQWWGAEEHKLEFDVDGEYLVLQVSDNRNPFKIPFEERSHGFQWFFSFYLVFLVESKKAHKGAILLLDEPGLHLHPTLQMKLIKFFERVSADNQLLYSTHLPFLVDGNHLERVRTVHLSKDRMPAKTIVSTDVRPTGDKDTLFPLQAALGYSIAQTLFLGKRTVIVEGITDYWIIKALDACIAAEGKGGGLHADTVLIPAGGTSRLMPLASVMLASTEGVEGSMLVMLDSDTEGAKAAKRLEQAFGREAPVIMLGTVLGRGEATIEDLILRDVYVDAVKRSGHRVELNDAERRETLTVRALEMAFQRLGLGDFGIGERAAATVVLLDDWGKDSSKVPAQTKTAARALIEAINKHFSK